MKSTKKLLSVLLSVLMLALTLSCVSVCFTAGAAYNAGDIIELGSYPQTRVKDSSLISALDGVNKGWIYYKYYTGTGNNSDGKMSLKESFMKYADIKFNGVWYRAVTFTAYRPMYTGYKLDTTGENSYVYTNGYRKNTVYYFKYEPLKWRVLNPATGLVVCDKVIDSVSFQDYLLYSNGEYYGNAGKSFFANNYKESSIRNWLNGTFYYGAFETAAEKNAIKKTTLDNRSAYSNYTSAYDAPSTSDYIFLLSYDDAINTSYFKDTADHWCKPTDYALCQGVAAGSYGTSPAYWWLRSAGGSSKNGCSVGTSGEVWTNNNEINFTCIGARPAMTMSLSGAAEQSQTQQEGGNAQQSGKVCKYCGEVHEGFFQKIVGFFHSILALFGLHK